MDKHNQEWFLNRIGKRIKRGKCGDCCEDCRNPSEFTIEDEYHAEYLFMVQNDLNIKYEEL